MDETSTSAKPASDAIRAQHGHLSATLPFSDRQDFEDARRGFIAALEPGVVRDGTGRVVWDIDSYGFLSGAAPDTVNPSLWRQSQLGALQGLYEVVPGLYQVRGVDLSEITFIEGDAGVVVIDPLISVETAAAALALYREHRGNRPVTGVLYTHSHVDHFGGVRGVVDQADVDSGAVPIIAPVGFTGHAVSENVFAGTAMSRRAGYMYGASLERGPRGQVGAGLGLTTSTGTVTLIPPTVEITSTGQELTVDGVRMEFQLAPGSEAPAEMHIHLPHLRALCMAENATHVLHNILTIRGALVRDPHAWSRYISEAIELFGDRTDVVFASHHWPTWGQDRAIHFLELQRDLYAYLHDQTVRMMNLGMTGSEIAEAIQMPPALENAWHARGYYGSVSHNVKAVYQRYMGWYDGNPANLWKHPPTEAGRRYLDYMGGRGCRGGQGGGLLRRRGLPLGCRGAQSRGVRRARPRSGPRTPRRHFRAARLRSGERDLAVRLPLRRPRAAPRVVRHAGQRERPRPLRATHAGAVVRRDRHPGGRAPRVGPAPHHRHRPHRRPRGPPPHAEQRGAVPLRTATLDDAGPHPPPPDANPPGPAHRARGD